ncbi:MAG: uroporphyrinogen-III C-methyltransferase [Leptospiraceae bacterium]|nr:uroporphyrinogen-III C-methyltransferase [Leptospiraceae bacterium]
MKPGSIQKTGFVSLVGAGPGSPDYLTLKGFRRLQEAEVILYDALIDDAFLEYFPADSIQIFAGKRKGLHSKTQDEIHQYMKHFWEEGKRIVRLKGVDAFLFGRGAEEVIFLRKNGIPYEVIPGVSSMQAASALCEIPLTHRGISREVLILGGSSLQNFDFQILEKFSGTIVFFMGSEVVSEFCELLIQSGKNILTPIALLERVSFPDQAITIGRIQDFASGDLRKSTAGPGIIIVGEVVNVLKNESPATIVNFTSNFGIRNI